MKVTIIVPTYNSASTLEVCLQSIVEQTYEDIELIVVDNSSRDKTKEIASRFTDHVFDQPPERTAQKNR